MNETYDNLKSLLDEAVERINVPQFVESDPVKFPRMFGALPDVEIVAFVCSLQAWGRRGMILRDCSRLLDMMEWQPFSFVMEEGWRSLDASQNIHRTFFVRNLAYFLRGLREVYKHHASLDAFSAACSCGASEAPAWSFADALRRVMLDVNEGEACPQCIPSNIATTALKRFNMALRWLVRDDGIVDMGVWRSIPKSKLYLPLDVHVGNLGRELGLLTRRSADRKAVEQLTAALRPMNPADPAIYDFALFGLGVERAGTLGIPPVSRNAGSTGDAGSFIGVGQAADTQDV